MSFPAALPALLVLAGVVAGTFLPAPLALPAAALIVMGWAGAVTAFALRSLRALVVLVGVGFFATGSLPAIDASSRAVQSPLRTLYDEHLPPTESRPDPMVVEGRLRRDATPTDYGASLSIAAERAVIDGLTYGTAGGIRVSVGGTLVSGRIDAWRAGRRVRMPVLLRRPAPYLNPGCRIRRDGRPFAGLALLVTLHLTAALRD